MLGTFFGIIIVFMFGLHLRVEHRLTSIEKILNGTDTKPKT